MSAALKSMLHTLAPLDEVSRFRRQCERDMGRRTALAEVEQLPPVEYPCYGCGEESTCEIQHRGTWLDSCDECARPVK